MVRALFAFLPERGSDLHIIASLLHVFRGLPFIGQWLSLTNLSSQKKKNPPKSFVKTAISAPAVCPPPPGLVYPPKALRVSPVRQRGGPPPGRLVDFAPGRRTVVSGAASEAL